MSPIPPKVSVIIPCFNLGDYLDEAVDSVLSQTFQDFEIVIVNDGSTSPSTLEKLSAYDRPKTRVIHSTNSGLAAARNLGIEHAAGEYIFPLDADDRIGSTYLEQASVVLDRQPEVGIVYSEAQWFGERTGKFDLPPYRFPDILFHNLIFSSAFFRRTDWKLVGGYSSELIYGWEDYDLWLSLIELGREVYRLPEILFFYRWRADSMARGITRAKQVYTHEVLFRRHQRLYSENVRFLFEKLVYQQDKKYLKFQVYFPLNGSYTEGRSVIRFYEPQEPQLMKIELPRDWRQGALRIDAADGPCVLEISEISLNDASEGSVLWRMPLTEIGTSVAVAGTAAIVPDKTLLRILSYGPDPQIYLPAPPVAERDQPVTMEIKFHAGTEARDLFQVAQPWAEAFCELERRIDEMRKSVTWRAGSAIHKALAALRHPK